MGIHHFVAMKGHLGREVTQALAFRGLEVRDLSQPVGSLDEIEKAMPRLRETGACGACRVFAD